MPDTTPALIEHRRRIKPEPELGQEERLEQLRRADRLGGGTVRAWIAQNHAEQQERAVAKAENVGREEVAVATAVRRGKRQATHAADYGPRVRRERGDIERTEGACPDDPKATVRRGRAVCQYDRLHARGGLTSAEREAADRYAWLLEQESGAKDKPLVSTGRCPPWMQGHPADMQIKAAAKLRTAHIAIGHYSRALLRRFIGENQPVNEIARHMTDMDRRPMDEKQCMGRIRAALTRLAELWGME